MIYYEKAESYEKLKTLKDIKEIKGGKTKLRAEAVKWYKYFKKQDEIMPSAVEVSRMGFIKNFFNLTEEDLKDEN